MILKIPIKNIMLEVLNELGLPPQCYQLESTDDGLFYVKVIFLHGETKGTRMISDKIGVNDTSLDDAKFIANFFALNALKAIYEFEVQDYSFRDLTLFKEVMRKPLVTSTTNTES